MSENKELDPKQPSTRKTVIQWIVSILSTLFLVWMFTLPATRKLFSEMKSTLSQISQDIKPAKATKSLKYFDQLELDPSNPLQSAMADPFNDMVRGTITMIEKNVIHVYSPTFKANVECRMAPWVHGKDWARARVGDSCMCVGRDANHSERVLTDGKKPRIFDKAIMFDHSEATKGSSE